MRDDDKRFEDLKKCDAAMSEVMDRGAMIFESQPEDWAALQKAYEIVRARMDKAYVVRARRADATVRQ